MLELEDENTRLREELARQELAARRLAGVASAAGLDALRPRAGFRHRSPTAGRSPVYAEAEAGRSTPQRLRSAISSTYR